MKIICTNFLTTDLKALKKKSINFVLIFVFSISVELFAQEKFTNPILAGFYPDPSICKVGSDYYLVNSTFSYYPGIPIHHSKDLINWKLIGYAMDRPEQINLDGLGVSRGIFAPAIMYNDGIFYITCTLVDAGGNFIVTSENPEGPYSNPYWLPEVNGIDPSMFFDDDGKAYIIYNSDAPDNKPLYDGHRTIRMYEVDLENFKIKGDQYILVNGGTDLSKKPVWIEGPHIYKKDSYYYLMAAEGGTSENHSEVIFRSKEITGPYIPYEKNPILTQRDLDPKRKNPITSTGHADIVETDSGDWWAVFLGCRPYPPGEEGYYNTGRETFLAPVKWIDGWPVINPDYEEVQYSYPYPMNADKIADIPRSGNFILRYEFDEENLNKNLLFLRTVREKWYSVDEKKGYLTLNVKPEQCSEKVNPSFVAQRQQHLKGYASTSFDFNPGGENEKAGLVVFQNENHFYFLAKSLENSEYVMQLFKSVESDSSMELLASEKISEELANKEIKFKIEADNGKYSFLYSFNEDDWQVIKDNVDGRFLSTKDAGGFVGAVFALYATSMGKESENSAYFNWLEYAGDDAVYK